MKWVKVVHNATVNTLRRRYGRLRLECCVILGNEQHAWLLRERREEEIT